MKLMILSCVDDQTVLNPSWGGGGWGGERKDDSGLRAGPNEIYHNDVKTNFLKTNVAKTNDVKTKDVKTNLHKLSHMTYL